MSEHAVERTVAIIQARMYIQVGSGSPGREIDRMKSATPDVG
jgi:hypothetical protein